MNRRNFLMTSMAASILQWVPQIATAQKIFGRPFRWVPTVDLAILDPVFTTAAITQTHGQLVFDTLYGLDDNLEPSPQMALGHTVSDDKLTWTFTLRKGLLFHDNTPVRAQDAVASINRWGKRDLLGRTMMASVEEMKTLDDHTFQIKLKKPFPLILNALAQPGFSMAAIMPERLAETPATTAVKECIGSGPFRFVADKWLSGSQVVYDRFAGYVPRSDAVKTSFTAGPKIAYVPGVNWHIIPDNATAVAALMAGEVDGVERVDIDFLPMLKSNPNIKLIRRSLPSISVMRFNHLHAPFNNPEMRRAILAVVDQTEYMKAANGNDFPEYWSDRCGVFTPDTPMDSDASMDKLLGKRDMAKAKAMIKAAGYNNEPIVLLDPADHPNHHASALVTAELFKKLGLNVIVDTVDWGTMQQRRNSKAEPGKGGWSVAFTALPGVTALDPAVHLGIRGNGMSAWFGWPDNPTLEKLRDEWLIAPDQAARKAVARKIQEQVLEDVPYIPLGALYLVSALRSDWIDFEPRTPLFYTLKHA